jgi:hypothetical protein
MPYYLSSIDGIATSIKNIDKNNFVNKKNQSRNDKKNNVNILYTCTLYINSNNIKNNR